MSLCLVQKIYVPLIQGDCLNLYSNIENIHKISLFLPTPVCDRSPSYCLLFTQLEVYAWPRVEFLKNWTMSSWMVLNFNEGSPQIAGKCFFYCSSLMLSALISWLSSPGSSPGQGHCVVFLARHLTLTVPLSTQVYKWVPSICWGNLTNCGAVTCDRLASHPGEQKYF